MRLGELLLLVLGGVLLAEALANLAALEGTGTPSLVACSPVRFLLVPVLTTTPRSKPDVLFSSNAVDFNIEKEKRLK